MQGSVHYGGKEDAEAIAAAINFLRHHGNALAALARRVEGAGIAHVEPKNGVAVIHERAMPLDMIGQRVALVPVEGGA